MKNICLRFLAILASMLILSIIWEFWVEGYVHSSEQETLSVKGEYVATIFIFTLLALVGPLLLALKAEKDRNEIELDREKLILELHETIKSIKKLEGIIPICSYCKQIRDEQGAWSQLEKYIHDHSGAQFSHGICPQCLEKMDAELT